MHENSSAYIQLVTYVRWLHKILPVSTDIICIRKFRRDWIRKILTILYNKMRHNNQLRFNYKCGTYRPGIGNKLCFVHLRNLVNFQLVTRHDWWEVCLNSLTLLIRSKPSSSCLLSIGKRCSWCSTPGYCTIISGVKKNMRCFFYLIVRHSHINYFVQ